MFCGPALIDNRRGVCAAASCRRRPGARSGGPDEDATPVGVPTGGPASAGGASAVIRGGVAQPDSASACRAEGCGFESRRPRLGAGWRSSDVLGGLISRRSWVRIPPLRFAPTWLSGDGTGFVNRLRKDGVGSSPTVGSVTVAQGGEHEVVNLGTRVRSPPVTPPCAERGAIGSAPGSHPGGRRFDPCRSDPFEQWRSR